MLKKVSMIMIISTLLLYAEDDFEVPDRLDVVSLDESTVFSLPSPHEILTVAKQRGVNIDPTKAFGLFKEPMDDLAKISRIESVFVLGRMFSVAGLSYENLSNENILQIADRIHKGVKAIDLPASLKNELEVHYNVFLKQPKLERQQLVMAFTETRASLIAKLHEGQSIPQNERDAMQVLGISLELGLWYQSLSLALKQAKSAEQLNAIAKVFLMKDILSYFEKSLNKALEKNIKSPFLNMLLQTNHLLQKSSLDESLSRAEQQAILKQLDLIVY